MTARAAALALACACLLTGCVLKHSPPSRLYVLDAAAEAAAPRPGAASRGAVGVRRVSLPAWIDRPEITRRSGQGEIEVDGSARWGEPFARGIQRVVAENLARLLPERHVVTEPFPVGPAVDHRVEITISEAARQADGSVLLEARWGIFAGDGASLLKRRSSHRTTPPAGAAGTVAGTSEALALLSREIADALQALPVPPAAPAEAASRP